MHPKPVQSRFISALGFRRDESRVDLEEDVVEGCAKICAVDGIVATAFRIVEVLTFGAIEFH